MAYRFSADSQVGSINGENTIIRDSIVTCFHLAVVWQKLPQEGENDGVIFGKMCASRPREYKFHGTSVTA